MSLSDAGINSNTFFLAHKGVVFNKHYTCLLKLSSLLVFVCLLMLSSLQGFASEGVVAPLKKAPDVKITGQAAGVQAEGEQQAAGQRTSKQPPTEKTTIVVEQKPAQSPVQENITKEPAGIKKDLTPAQQTTSVTVANETAGIQEPVKRAVSPLSRIMSVLLNIAGILLGLIFIIAIIRFLKTRTTTRRSSEKNLAPQGKENGKSKTVSDAVVSFVRHRLKK